MTAPLTDEQIAELTKRLRERRDFGLFGSRWMMLTTPDKDCVAAAIELERLRAQHDALVLKVMRGSHREARDMARSRFVEMAPEDRAQADKLKTSTEQAYECGLRAAAKVSEDKLTNESATWDGACNGIRDAILSLIKVKP